MKTKLTVLLIAVATIIGCSKAKAQFATTNLAVIVTDTNLPVPGWWTTIIGFNQGASDAKTITIAAYPIFAQGLVVNGKSDPWGFGVSASYPIAPDTLGNYLFSRLSLDYVGQSFFGLKEQVGAKVAVQLFGLNVTPYVVGGSIQQLSSPGVTSVNAATVGFTYGAGMTARLWSNASGNFAVNVFYELERTDLFPGINEHKGAVALTFKF